MTTEAVRSFCYNSPVREICNPQHLWCSPELCKCPLLGQCSRSCLRLLQIRHQVY